MAIKHKRQSDRRRNGDAGAIQPEDWNEEHDVDGFVGELIKLGTQSDVMAYLGTDKNARFSPLTEAARVILGTASFASLLATMGAVAKSGDSMTGDLSMTGNKVSGVGAPTAASDAATKAYVDALAMVVSGALVFKGAWDAATGSFPGGGDAQVGWFYLVTGAGDVDGRSFSVGDNIYAMTADASTSTYDGEWIKIEGILTRAEIEGALGYALGTASAQNVEAFATAAQGAKADSAIQANNLGSAAFQNTTAFATAAQGTKADNAIPTSQKAAASGVATLDAGGKIPVDQLPAAAITDTFIVNSQAAMLAFPTAFFPDDIFGQKGELHSKIPNEAIAITTEQWLELINNSGYRKWLDGEIVIYDPPPPPVDLYAYAADARWRKEIGGITVNGVPIATDDRSKQMIIGARLAASVNPNWSTMWVGSDADIYPVDATAIVTISDAVQSHVNACFTMFADVKADIDNGTVTTVQEIDGAFNLSE